MKRLDRLLQRFRIQKVTPYIKRGARILDIGCADGVLYTEARDLAVYVGIDPDAPTTSAWPNARFIRDTFPTKALDRDEKFDLIVALAVLEHIPTTMQPAFAKACAEHLSAGGFIALTVPSPAVDRILATLKGVRLLDGMREDQHYGYDPSSTRATFEPWGLRLHRHHFFELGLNHLFVFQQSSP